MIRKGSQVVISPNATQNPVYAGAAQKGLRFKVKNIVTRGAQKFAVVGDNGITLPMAILAAIPQKKGKAAEAAALAAVGL